MIDRGKGSDTTECQLRSDTNPTLFYFHYYTNSYKHPISWVLPQIRLATAIFTVIIKKILQTTSGVTIPDPKIPAERTHGGSRPGI